MTIQEAITNTDAMIPNLFEEGVKLTWLNEVENRVYRTMSNRQIDIEPHHIDMAYDYDEELLAPEGYTNIYTLYLEAMINYSNGETARYNNSMIMFADAYAEFENYIYRTYPQRQSGQFRR